MVRRYRQWASADEGATMVEYAIMAVAIAAVVVFVAYAVGLGTENAYETLNTCFPNGAGC